MSTMDEIDYYPLFSVYFVTMEQGYYYEVLYVNITIN